MPSLNKITLIGHLGRDAEIRAMQNGNEVVHLSVATSEGWKDKQTGEWKNRTEWHRVVVFNTHLVKVATDLRKGDLVYVEGKLQTRKWQGKDGQDRYTTEVVVPAYRGEVFSFVKKEERQERREEGSGDDSGDEDAEDGFDDEIPFN